MTWDLALPSDPPEMRFLCEGEKYRVVIREDRHGETYYQSQYNSIITGFWEDDTETFWDEYEAVTWFNDNEYSSDDEEE